MANKTYKAIVLRAVKYGEQDKMLTLFTLEGGKMSAVAKGAQSARSKFLGSSQSYCFGEYVLSESLKMPYLSSAEVINGFKGIGRDIRLLCAAAYICEIITVAFEEASEDRSAFMLLYHSLKLLEGCPGEKSLVLSTAFALKMLGINGSYPALDRCVNCGKVGEDYFFSPKEGGIVCADCVSAEGLAIFTASQGLYLFDLLFCGMDKILSLNAPSGQEQKYLFKQINNYLVYTLGKNIKSFEMLYQL